MNGIWLNYTKEEIKFIIKCYNKGNTILQTVIEHNKIKEFPSRSADSIRHQLEQRGLKSKHKSLYKEKILFLLNKGLKPKDILMILPTASMSTVYRISIEYRAAKRRELEKERGKRTTKKN